MNANTVEGYGSGGTLSLQDDSTPSTIISLSASNITVTGTVVPSATATYDFGSTTRYWKTSYISAMHVAQIIGTPGGPISIDTEGVQNAFYATNGTASFLITGTSHLIQIVTGSVAPAGVAVAISNAPTGVAAFPVEYWEVLGVSGAARYIPLLGVGIG